SGGAFARRGLGGPWQEIAGGAWRALPTGSPRYPVLLAGAEAAQLFDRESGRTLRLELPGPARDVAAALVAGGPLSLGTSGYRLLLGALPAAGSAPQVTARR